MDVGDREIFIEGHPCVVVDGVSDALPRRLKRSFGH